MTRRFRFRVREGHQVHRWGDARAATHGAGYELVLSEEESARMLRDRGNRAALELVEVVEDEATTPPAEQLRPMRWQGAVRWGIRVAWIAAALGLILAVGGWAAWIG